MIAGRTKRAASEALVTATAPLVCAVLSVCFCLSASAQSAVSLSSASPRVAVKTNLLFDAASALNVEIEVPFARRWSAAGEWIFPWWLAEKRQRAVQAGVATVEGRLWLGNRAAEKTMTGWFAGVYAGGGYYDLEWDEKGAQGELFHVGLSGGFAHPVNRGGSLRLEYSLGLGYMVSKYRHYSAVRGADERWHLMRRSSGTYYWLGPTRAKVSLVWIPDFRRREKGGSR